MFTPLAEAARPVRHAHAAPLPEADDPESRRPGRMPASPRPSARNVRFAPGSQIPAGPVDQLALIVTGWACEAQTLADGRRLIFGFRLPGDAIILPASADADRIGLWALSPLEIAPVDARRDDDPLRAGQLVAARAEAHRQLCDHVLRLGALSASQRTAHLLLEFHARLARIGLVKCDSYRVPVTQDTMADALGISAVHLNRILQKFRKAELIGLRSGKVTIPNLDALKAAAGQL